MSKQRVKLGKKYRDTISGFEGIATATYNYLNGCVRVELTGEYLADKEKIPCKVFDDEQVEEVKAPAKPNGRRSGGPQSMDPVSRP